MKRRMIFIITMVLLITALFAGCGTGTAAVTATMKAAASAAPSVSPADSPAPAAEAAATPEAKKFLIKHNYDSKAIAQNLNGEKPAQEIYVLLPPSYYTSEKRYPVVYYISGFAMAPGSLIGLSMRDLDKAMSTGDEFILVEIDGRNQYGGSFLVNSPVSGNWEDYAINEIVPMIDSQYRTIASVKARGIAGFSMGGFAALNLAMRHPDVFCAVYALCPGLLKDNGLAEAMKSWESDPQFLLAYGQAFCPKPDITDTLSAKPAMDGSEADAAIVKKWESGFGNLQQKIDDYLALGAPLKAIAIEYGESDAYTWIPKGCVSFSKLLDAKGITHTLKSFAGGHTVSPRFATKSLMPFFIEAFKE